jgi:hypothetical protein
MPQCPNPNAKNPSDWCSFTTLALNLWALIGPGPLKLRLLKHDHKIKCDLDPYKLAPLCPCWGFLCQVCSTSSSTFLVVIIIIIITTNFLSLPLLTNRLAIHSVVQSHAPIIRPTLALLTDFICQLVRFGYFFLPAHSICTSGDSRVFKTRYQ